MIKRYWDTFRYFGVEKEMKLLEQKRIMLLNEISIFLTLSVLLFYIPISIYDGDLLFNLSIVVISALSIATPLILDYHHKIHLARWYFSLSNILTVPFMIIGFGDSVRLDFVWLMQVGLVMIFFRYRWYRILLISLCVVGFFVSNAYLSNNNPLFEPSGFQYNFVVTFIYVLLGIIIIIGRYVSATTQIEEQLQSSLSSLQHKQEQLILNRHTIGAHNEELAAANQELEQFAYVASHDLKSPIRNISSFLMLIKRKLKNHKDENIHEYIEFATNSANQMHTLIQDILEYSRINRTEESDLIKINLAELVSGIEENMHDIITERNALIAIEKLPTIKCNPDYVYILFENLIENGILYNEKNIPAVKIIAQERRNVLEIRVLDNGIGIPEEHHLQIFEMFKRLHTQVKYKGSGIGLAVCKKIVETMEGTIRVESQANQGSIFIIELPKYRVL